MAGTGSNTFTPNAAVTRAMFARMLANLSKADLSIYTGSRFSDVPLGQWYTQAIEWAADKGVTAGTGNGKFSPNANITREQMAVMLNNYIKYMQILLPAGETVTAFNDAAQISPWAADAVTAIQSCGLINGKPGNVYDPKNTATRAEAATVFAPFIGVTQK